MTDTTNEPVDTGSQQLDIAARIAAEATATEAAKDADKGAEAEAGDKQNTEESANSDGNDAPAQQARKKPGVHQRIDELTKAKHDAIRERDYWREQATRLAPAQKVEAPAQAAKPVEGKPTLESCDFDQELLVERMAEWKLGERDRAAQQAKEQETQQQKRMEFQRKVEEFAAATPDYHERVSDPSLQITEHMVQVMLETENPPAVAYHLAQHPELAAAIAQMSEVNAARAIGRIEAQLSAPASAAPVEQAPPRPPVTVTKAPPPVSTLKSSGVVAKSIDDPSLTMEEYVAERRKQQAAQQGR